MKLAVLAAGILALSAPAFADPLDPLIEAYESFALASDPGEAARAAGTAPTGWGHVRPRDVSARAAEARSLLEEIEASAPRARSMPPS
jgi:hypothetical protein